MKKIYKLLIFAILIGVFTEKGFAQLEVEYAVAVDTSKDGYYDAIEIRFSEPVNDTLLKTSITGGKWLYTMVKGDYNGAEYDIFQKYNTKVEYITSADVDNDEYYRIGFENGGGIPVTGSAMRWIKYSPGVVKDATNTDVLAAFEDTIAWDKTPPIINSVTSSPVTTGDTLIVGETLTFTVSTINEDSIIVLPDSYNGQTLIWTKAPPYEATYTVINGELNQWTPLQLTGVTLKDTSENISDSYDGTDVNWAIDANIPEINTITVSASSTRDTLIVGDQLIFTLIPEVTEVGLIVSESTFNGGDIVWTTSDGSSYTGVYTVENNQTDLSGPLQITGVTLSDKAGNVSTVPKNSNAVPKAIDAHIPIIR